MARKPKADIIRVYDTVRIIKPHLFVRCGYPMTIESESEVVRKELGEKIRKFLLECLPPQPGDYFIQEPGLLAGETSIGERTNAFDKIVREFAYFRCRQQRWGGRIRGIYTEEVPDLIGREYSVVGFKFVKTGEYFAGSGSYSYWTGEYDYDPPYLGNEKTHKILQINYCHNNQFWESWIEAANVEKVHVGVQT